MTRGSVREVAAHIQRLTQEVERWRFRAGQLVIIDEASLAGTASLDRIVACAGEAGAKVLLVGDWAQLSAIDAGGAFGLLVRDRGTGAPELGTARRFSHAWEREAAALLRVGDPDCLRFYEHHGRVREGDHDDMVDGAYATWRVDELAGKRSLLIAGDGDTVRALNERARAELVVAGRVVPDGSRLRDGLFAGVGDRVVTRRNDRRLTVGPRWVKNGDTWIVTARHNDGALTVKRPRGGPSVTLPATYVRGHVELGYATTAFRAQGATVDTAHAIVTGPGLTREVLYVMLTRAREANTAYVCTDRPVEPLHGFSEAPTTGRGVLTSVMERRSRSLRTRDERAGTRRGKLHPHPRRRVRHHRPTRSSRALDCTPHPRGPRPRPSRRCHGIGRPRCPRSGAAPRRSTRHRTRRRPPVHYQAGGHRR